MTLRSLPLLLVALTACAPQSESVPFVYDVEHTGAAYAEPAYADFDQLPEQRELPDPLAWADGSGRVTQFAEWSRRRAEIAHLLQHYEIGRKPAVAPEQIHAQMQGDTLIVDVTVGDSTLRLTSELHYPDCGDQGPFALMIGTSHNSLPQQLFTDRKIVTMDYHERQVNGYSQWMGNTDRQTYGFVHLYPELIDNGAYSEWAWGLSRLIDGLQQLGEERTHIDMHRIGVTGCSYAGKMALFCGAFDERVALTIAQEPGGGGAAAWRRSHEMPGVEDLDHTDYHWFKESLREQFHGDSVYRLPYDHHELVSMVCPRALLLLGNPDYRWLADSSMLLSAQAAHQVWARFGVGDRMGWSIVPGHPHCMLPEQQYPEVEAYLDRFLLGKDSVATRVAIHPWQPVPTADHTLPAADPSADPMDVAIGE